MKPTKDKNTDETEPSKIRKGTYVANCWNCDLMLCTLDESSKGYVCPRCGVVTKA